VSNSGLFAVDGGALPIQCAAMRHESKRGLRVVSGRQATAPSDLDMPSGSYIPNSFRWSQRMYAIAFDLDTEMLNKHYPGNSPHGAYGDIERFLAPHGFARQQGSVYFGDAKFTDPVKCTIMIQGLVKKHPWFRAVVRDIRLLRVEDNNDLMPAVGDFVLDLAPPIAAE